jgi:hypothetical protein
MFPSVEYQRPRGFENFQQVDILVTPIPKKSGAVEKGCEQKYSSEPKSMQFLQAENEFQPTAMQEFHDPICI